MIKIRPALTSDFEAYCALVTEVDALHTAAEPLYFQDPGIPARSRDYFEGLLADPDKAVFLAEFGGAPAGYLHIEERKIAGPPILVSLRFAYVGDIVVAKAFQRQGLGMALMAEAERWARARGLLELRLNVRGFNASAAAFYEAQGFGVLMKNLGKRLERS